MENLKIREKRFQTYTAELLKPKDDRINKIISHWTFFQPKIEIVERILVLNDKLGTEYFQKEYNNLLERENHLDDKEFEKNLHDFRWHRRLFAQISEVIFHDDKKNRIMSDKEFLSFSQKYISERIYNHLAMLARSPHAEKGGAFSLREELTEEFAENIGLGLYLTDKISGELRAEVESVLYALAENFEEWFIDERQGHFPTLFGDVFSSEKLEGNRRKPALILSPDVRKGKASAAKT